MIELSYRNHALKWIVLLTDIPGKYYLVSVPPGEDLVADVAGEPGILHFAVHSLSESVEFFLQNNVFPLRLNIAKINKNDLSTHLNPIPG